MIASHNTFSYLPSNRFMEFFSYLWRCQDKNATEQIKLGVELCDIRVKYHKGHWRLCHGKAMFGEKFSSLEYLIRYCIDYGFKSYRLMYESNDSGYYKFLTEFYGLPSWMRSRCIAALNKQKWDCVYGNINAIQEHNKHMWYKEVSFLKNLRNFLSSTIKGYAKKHNRLYEGSDIHMYDYVQYMKE